MWVINLVQTEKPEVVWTFLFDNSLNVLNAESLFGTSG